MSNRYNHCRNLEELELAYEADKFNLEDAEEKNSEDYINLENLVECDYYERRELLVDGQ